MGHARSKTRSLGQILEKPCVRSRGQIFSPIFMKFSQNVCLDVNLGRARNCVMSDLKKNKKGR